MLRSMTGFAQREKNIPGLGRVRIELKSINHKFLEVILHLPEGFLSWEERIKKIIEASIKRGRVVCVINVIGSLQPQIFLNQGLLKNYLVILKKIQKEFRIKEDIPLETLINLPGVLSLREMNFSNAVWNELNSLLKETLTYLIKAREKEGEVLARYLSSYAFKMQKVLENIKKRFKKKIAFKIKRIQDPQQRSLFLKETDITEEIARLDFHIKNFLSSLKQNRPIGKELDFMAQEMQREANTIAAKALDAQISAKVIEIKSQIEKIREQVQNIE